MPTSPRLSLAHLVEKIFDQEISPQVKALLTVPLLGLGLWFISLNSRLPTRSVALAAARQAAGRGIVTKKYLTPRERFALGVVSNGRLIEKDFWEYYYPPAVATDTLTPLSYEDSQRLSLTAYAQAGDSLCKQPGSLLVQVKHGAIIRTFQYRNPYP